MDDSHFGYKQKKSFKNTLIPTKCISLAFGIRKVGNDFLLGICEILVENMVF
jgi:hypothetical protein